MIRPTDFDRICYSYLYAHPVRAISVIPIEP